MASEISQGGGALQYMRRRHVPVDKPPILNGSIPNDPLFCSLQYLTIPCFTTWFPRTPVLKNSPSPNALPQRP